MRILVDDKSKVEEMMKSKKQADFSTDVGRAIIYTLFTLIIIAFLLSPFSLNFFFGSLGIFGMLIYIALVSFTLLQSASLISVWISIAAYRGVSKKYDLPYMRGSQKCPFLTRKRLVFSCAADRPPPIFQPQDLAVKCHDMEKWQECWKEKAPKIIQHLTEAENNKDKKTDIQDLGLMKYQPACEVFRETLKHEISKIDTQSVDSKPPLENGFDPTIVTIIAWAVAEINATGKRGCEASQFIDLFLQAYPQIPNRLKPFIEKSMISFGNLGVPFMLNVLSDNKYDIYQRILALRALTTIKDPTTFPFLLKMLSNPSSYPELEDTDYFGAILEASMSLAHKSEIRELLLLYDQYVEAQDSRVEVFKNVFQDPTNESLESFIYLLEDEELPQSSYDMLLEVIENMSLSKLKIFVNTLYYYDEIDKLREFYEILKKHAFPPNILAVFEAKLNIISCPQKVAT